MKLIVGLGNPGPTYAGNRHNVGFMVVEELCRRARGAWSSKFKAEMARVELGSASAVLLKPQTYMNLSGDSVGACARFFGIEPPDILVVHDELDVPYGEIRLKLGGGHAGHNGLKSIFQHVAPKGDFPRVRVGVGRPQFGDAAKWVLADFSKDERIDLDRLLTRASDASERFVTAGIAVAMNEFNGAATKPAPKAPAKPQP